MKSYVVFERSQTIKLIVGGVCMSFILMLALLSVQSTMHAANFPPPTITKHTRGGEDKTNQNLFWRLADDAENLKLLAEKYIDSPSPLTISSFSDSKVEDILDKLVNEFGYLRQAVEKHLDDIDSRQPETLFSKDKLTLHQFLEKYKMGSRVFDGIHFEKADFSFMSITASFQESTFKHCSFERTMLVSGNVFKEAKLYNVRFDWSRVDATFQGAYMEDCSFAHVIFTGPLSLPLQNAYLRSVSFRKVQVGFRLFYNTTIIRGNFEDFSSPSSGSFISGFHGATLIDTDLSNLKKDENGILEFKSFFCGTRQLTRVKLAGIKIRLPVSPGSQAEWESCLSQSRSWGKTKIYECDFRKVVVVNDTVPNQPLVTFKEFLSKYTILDDKTLF
jgi:hypothetical protein